MGITHILVFRDSKLIVQQIKEIYQTKNPRMRAYRNAVWDLIDNLFHALILLLSLDKRTKNIMQ